jgi:hypothetical protein
MNFKTVMAAELGPGQWEAWLIEYPSEDACYADMNDADGPYCVLAKCGHAHLRPDNKPFYKCVNRLLKESNP